MDHKSTNFAGERSPAMLALDRRQNFRGLALELSEIVANFGVSVTPFDSPDLPHFSKLSVEKQVEALTRLDGYVSICRELEASGVGLQLSSVSLTWRALREFGWLPNSEMFSFITEADIVEIYDLNNVQVFRNFKFFEFCSYTLEDLYSRDWVSLFVRTDFSVTEKILAILTRLYKEGSREVVKTNIGNQIIQEADSARRNIMNAEVKYLVALYSKTGQPCGFVAIEKAELLSRPVRGDVKILPELSGL